MLLNPILSPLVVQSQTNSEQTLLPSNKRRHTDNSNESSSSSSLSKTQFPPSLLAVASDVANVFVNQLNSVSQSSTTATITTTTTTTTSSPSLSSSSKSSISTCYLCGKRFQTNDYLQLHLLNKHQITTDVQNYDSQQPRTKISNLLKSSNGILNSNTVKKIKLETNETSTPSSSSSSSSTTTTTATTTTTTTTTTAAAAAVTTTTTTTATTPVLKASSPVDTMTSPNPSTVIPGIVDTYFAAKMADRVSCDICHKVNIHS